MVKLKLNSEFNLTIRRVQGRYYPLGQSGPRSNDNNGIIHFLSLTGLNSEFSFSLTGSLTKDKEPILLYYLSIAGGRIIRFIPLLRILEISETLLVASKIWTRVAVSIFYDDNHYTTGIISCLKSYYCFL